MDKVDKVDARYVAHSTHSTHRCGNCIMFQDTETPSDHGTCTKVSGTIARAGWCRFWSKEGR